MSNGAWNQSRKLRSISLEVVLAYSKYSEASLYLYKFSNISTENRHCSSLQTSFIYTSMKYRSFYTIFQT